MLVVKGDCKYRLFILKRNLTNAMYFYLNSLTLDIEDEKLKEILSEWLRQHSTQNILSTLHLVLIKQ